MEISVSTINDSQPLTVVTKIFVLDATGVLDPRDRFKSDFKIDSKLVRASVLTSLYTLSVSAVQSSKITLEQCFGEIQKSFKRSFFRPNE